MKQKNGSLRDRLLSRLPEPGNLEAYREQTSAFLLKHKKALSSERWSARLLSVCAVGVFFVSNSMGAKLNADDIHMLWVIAAVLFLVAALGELRWFLYGTQVTLLKEVKQVQLQILELQASIQGSADSHN